MAYAGGTDDSSSASSHLLSGSPGEEASLGVFHYFDTACLVVTGGALGLCAVVEPVAVCSSLMQCQSVKVCAGGRLRLVIAGGGGGPSRGLRF